MSACFSFLHNVADYELFYKCKVLLFAISIL